MSSCSSPNALGGWGIEGKKKRHTRWLVLRLSICFRKTSVHMSLQRNLITSNVSVNRGRSRENLLELPSPIISFCLPPPPSKGHGRASCFDSTKTATTRLTFHVREEEGKHEGKWGPAPLRTNPSPLNESLSDPIAQRLQPAERGFPLLLFVHGADAIFPRHGQFVREPVGHGHHLDQQQVDAGRVEECCVWIGGIIGGKRSLERH